MALSKYDLIVFGKTSKTNLGFGTHPREGSIGWVGYFYSRNNHSLPGSGGSLNESVGETNSLKIDAAPPGFQFTLCQAKTLMAEHGGKRTCMKIKSRNHHGNQEHTNGVRPAELESGWIATGALNVMRISVLWGGPNRTTAR